MITSSRSLTNERARRRELRLRQLEDERNGREAVIFRRIPRLADIKSLQSEIGLDLARLVLKVPTRFKKPFDELRAWSLQLSAEREELLRQHHVRPQELEVQWDCPACKNTGWLPPEEVDVNSVRPPHKCRCLQQEEIEDLYHASGLVGPLRGQTFDAFDLTVYRLVDRKYMENVVNRCREIAQRLSRGGESESILLTGDVGRGKTFLCSAIGNLLLEAKRTLVYFTFSEFLDLLRLAKFDEDDEYRLGVQRLLDADLIVLDDLGAEKVTEFAAQELFNIINHRMNRQLPMVVSTNLMPQEIEHIYGERIASRVVNGFSVVGLRGDDVRKVLKERRVNT